MSAIAGAIIGGVTGLANVGLGIADRIKGNKERKKAQAFFDANKYEIPEGAKASLQTAERMASGVRLPAEDLRRAQLGATTAQGVGAAQGAATSSSDVLDMVANLYGNQMRGEQDMAVEAASDWKERQSQLQRTQEMFGGYEDIQWQQNVLAPYNQRMNAAAQYSQRGAEGISSGVSGLAGTASSYMQEQGATNRYGEYMDYLRGNKK